MVLRNNMAVIHVNGLTHDHKNLEARKHNNQNLIFMINNAGQTQTLCSIYNCSKPLYMSL